MILSAIARIPKNLRHRENLESDALSMMLEQQYGIPTTDVWKSHLADCYAAYCKELQNTQKPIEIDKLFEPVNDTFNRHVRNLSSIFRRRKSSKSCRSS